MLSAIGSDDLKAFTWQELGDSANTASISGSSGSARKSEIHCL
jgi:hypothetical protein